jgi:LytS/YehU family sensor histidine kinase
MTDDLDALTFYIELEFMRLSVCEHQYEINIDEAIDPDKTFVPALLIQPFVENAIWHGLQKKESAGHLLIDLRMQGNELRCTIEDDGGGMDQKKIPVKRKSSGMVITKERLTLIHGAQHTRYEFRVEDVKNEAGSIIGTKIQFNMPYIKE